MGKLKERIGAFFNNRWLVFVAAMWLQSVAGIGYLFGSISPVIKTSLGYDQRQLARIGVAKDLGDSVGFLAGTLSEIVPLWVSLLIGAITNFLGYGWVWLIVTGRSPALPLWAMCVIIFIGTNGETYFNTVALVSCVKNFPKTRGPVVGILKGFAGLSGAILTQIYALLHKPEHASLIFMVAVGPSLVALGLLFIVRPVSGHRQVRTSDQSSFMIVYSICLLLASYLMGVMIVQDLVILSHRTIVFCTIALFFILFIPLVIPLYMSFHLDLVSPMEEPLISPKISREEQDEVILSEIEDEKSPEIDGLPEIERRKRIQQLQAKLCCAAASGAVRVKKKGRPHRGEDFTLTQALIKSDFWLIFFSLLLGAGSGLTVIDNLGQMSQSLGFRDSHIFVSMISIWNFLGRVAGGYFSEIVVRDHAYPRPIGTAVAQIVLSIGHFLFAMGWPGTMYIGTLLVGLGYGAHWAIIPATASELFGLKYFGAIYNFLTIANPAGSLIFSGFITSSLYDYEAHKQKHNHFEKYYMNINNIYYYGEGGELRCDGSICFFLSSIIMSGLCVFAAILSLILVYRTKRVYVSLYGQSLR